MNMIKLSVQDGMKSPQAWADTVLLDQHSASSHLIDELAEVPCNWIGILRPDWEIDLSGCSLSVADREDGAKYLTIQELIPLTQPLRYEAIVVDQAYWVYTICLRVAGLGRVRLVLGFDNPQLTGECIAFATNRLDWSPRKVLTQWFQYSEFNYSESQPNCEESFLAPTDHLFPVLH